VDERSPDFQIGSAAIQELKTLEQGPLVLAHDIAGQGACCTTLPSYGVHED
jgi:hypothetical protein